MFRVYRSISSKQPDSTWLLRQQGLNKSAFKYLLKKYRQEKQGDIVDANLGQNVTGNINKFKKIN